MKQMASATHRGHSQSHEDGHVGGDSAENKGTLMPKPFSPPSPPVTEIETETETETNTDPESPSMPLPPSISLAPGSGKLRPHTDSLAEEVNSPNPEHGGDESILRLGTRMAEAGNASDGMDTGSDSHSPIQPPIASPPPYWPAQNSQDNPSGYGRTAPSTSVDSLIPAGLGITLRDNECSSTDDRGSACWAKSVEVSNYVIVNGGATSIGAFVVWNIRVERLDGGYIDIRKRYSEFDDLRWRLMRTFPGFEAAVPELPPKSLISKFRPKFLEKRRAGLQYFLNCIMLNPEFSGSPVLKDFLFS